jgi:DedD protein
MAESSDAQLQLKKRARRRLVGAIAFAGLAAVVLPMVMDEEPKQQVQDVQIIIPNQDQAPFNPKALAAKSTPSAVPAPMPAASAAKPAAPVKPELVPTAVPSATPQKPVEAAPPAKPAAKAPEKTPEKAVEKKAEKKIEKPLDKPAEKSAKPVEETQRAAAILGGKAADAAPANGGGQHVILIGAFANAANVKQLQSKIGELGIKTYTEPLDSPQGKKTRVRAGPFANREAADKALDKLQRIGVSGVVAAKQ